MAEFVSVSSIAGTVVSLVASNIYHKYVPTGKTMKLFNKLTSNKTIQVAKLIKQHYINTREIPNSASIVILNLHDIQDITNEIHSIIYRHHTKTWFHAYRSPPIKSQVLLLQKKVNNLKFNVNMYNFEIVKKLDQVF